MKHSKTLLALAALATLLCGCGKEETTTVSPPPPPSNTTGGNTPGSNMGRVAGTLAQADLDAVKKASKPYRLALIVKTRNNPFFIPMIDAANKEAKELGAELRVEAPAQETDKERQFALVQDVTARGVDAILIAPADSKGIIPALREAEKKGVLIVNLDNRVDPDTAVLMGLELGAYVGADNEEGGRLAGKTMVEAMSGGGKVAVLEGIRGADNAEKRKDGFTEGVAGKLDIVAKETAEWDTQKAYEKFQSMQAAHPEIAGLFCANDKMALGALKAISEAGKTGKITVIGYDNIPDVKPYLEKAELYATIEQHPDLMGKYGVRAAVGILDGSIKRRGQFLVPLEVIRAGE